MCNGDASTAISNVHAYLQLLRFYLVPFRHILKNSSYSFRLFSDAILYCAFQENN